MNLPRLAGIVCVAGSLMVVALKAPAADYDVVVYGATAAGVTAAVQA